MQVGVLPFNAIKLSSYDNLRRKAMEFTAAQQAKGRAIVELDDDTVERASLPVPTVAAIGAVSGVSAATACFPLEVVRRRQMAGELRGYNTIQAMVSLVKSDGVGVLYKGVALNSVKVVLGNSLGFVLYELAKDVLMVDGRIPPWER